jgi:N-glycosylase/DNA lyase
MAKELLRAIEKLKKSNKVRKLVKNRLKEFQELHKASSEEIFKELCFCILTANFNAEKSIRIQKEIGDGFLHLSEHE